MQEILAGVAALAPAQGNAICLLLGSDQTRLKLPGPTIDGQ